jgi:delta24-sterol reductase
VRFDFEKDNKMMERVMLENGGRKVHYSHAYYPQELFYGQIYDGVYYAELRDRYGAEDAFPHVHQKVVTKEGGKL